MPKHIKKVIDAARENVHLSKLAKRYNEEMKYFTNGGESKKILP